MGIEELIGAAADGFQRYQRADDDRTQAALDVGAALTQLRELLPHGDFLPAIRRLGIADRTARDWMQLARSGMKTATVADLGGIRAALEHIRSTAKTGDEARAHDLVAENSGLRRHLAVKLVDADADTLEGLARLVRLQAQVQESRDQLNELITENGAMKRANAGLNRQRKGLVAAT